MKVVVDWPPEVEELRGQTVTTVERAARLLGIGRTLAYQLARERGELTPGVAVLRVGRLLRVPTYQLLAALGFQPDRASIGDEPMAGQDDK